MERKPSGNDRTSTENDNDNKRKNDYSKKEEKYTNEREDGRRLGGEHLGIIFMKQQAERSIRMKI